MSPRTILLLLGAVSLAASGCGKPATAEFVVSEQTKGLVRDAQRPVQAALESSFGTPQNLVAWRKLPVDFGEFQGVVEKSEKNEALSLASFPVSLTTKDGKPAETDEATLRGAAVLWESGEKASVKYELKGTEDYFQFQVAKYDPATKRISLKMSPLVTAADASTIAPQPGEKFTIVGPVLKHGRTLYMTHCLHCHGVSGDGNGPTAQYLNPLPRDYRQGKFKFTSTMQSEKGNRNDLQRIVKYGIPGTYMPSFLLLKDDELHAIIEYIRWLAMRGETEIKLVDRVKDYSTVAVQQRVKGGEKQSEIDASLQEYLKDSFAADVDSASTELADQWTRAEAPESLIVPKKKRVADDEASRARGRELYLSPKAKCATCHGPMGKGDGPQTEDFMPKPGSSEKFAKPGLHDDWGHPILPRDLTRGIYRGGRRPVDLYRRVYAGIKGTPMPAFGGTVLNDDEIWDLVNYVMSIPYSGPGAPPHAPVTSPEPKAAAASTGEATGNVATVSGNGGN